jgi:hypothetical protein
MKNGKTLYNPLMSRAALLWWSGLLNATLTGTKQSRKLSWTWDFLKMTIRKWTYVSCTIQCQKQKIRHSSNLTKKLWSINRSRNRSLRTNFFFLMLTTLRATSLRSIHQQRLSTLKNRLIALGHLNLKLACSLQARLAINLHHLKLMLNWSLWLNVSILICKSMLALMVSLPNSGIPSSTEKERISFRASAFQKSKHPLNHPLHFLPKVMPPRLQKVIPRIPTLCPSWSGRSIFTDSVLASLTRSSTFRKKWRDRKTNWAKLTHLTRITKVRPLMRTASKMMTFLTVCRKDSKGLFP